MDEEFDDDIIKIIQNHKTIVNSDLRYVYYGYYSKNNFIDSLPSHNNSIKFLSWQLGVSCD